MVCNLGIISFASLVVHRNFKAYANICHKILNYSTLIIIGILSAKNDLDWWPFNNGLSEKEELLSENDEILLANVDRALQSAEDSVLSAESSFLAASSPLLAGSIC